LGKEYSVLAMTVCARAWFHGASLVYQVVSDHGQINHCPFWMFEVVEDSIPSFWKVRHESNGDVLLWPPEFFMDFFHDRLSDGDPRYVDALKYLQARVDKK
jgi:hypothetical protein